MHDERVGDLTALHVRARGLADRGPLILLHGLWGGAWLFRDWLAPAADRGWDAWAVNLRGRSESRPVRHLGRVGLRDFAQDLRDVLVEIGPAAVVGYSMGGLITQMVAAEAPSRGLVREAVLLCSVPPRGVIALTGRAVRRSWRYLPAMVANRPMVPSRSDADAMLMNALPRDERDRVYPNFIADSGRAARQIAIGGVAVDPSAVTCPIWVVSAEHDRISPPAIQPRLVARYRAGHLPLASHAHLVTIEPGWQSVAEAILGLLEGDHAPRQD